MKRSIVVSFNYGTQGTQGTQGTKGTKNQMVALKTFKNFILEIWRENVKSRNVTSNLT